MIIDRFGDKWSLLILVILSENEVLRFNEILKKVPNIFHASAGGNLCPYGILRDCLAKTSPDGYQNKRGCRSFEQW